MGDPPPPADEGAPPDSLEAWGRGLGYESTANVEVPPRLLEQVIGQDEAVEVAKKAATQKRHMILIGEPGTGKSMLARAMVDFLPKEQLQDILAYPNVDDPNEPKIRVVPAGKGQGDRRRPEARGGPEEGATAPSSSSSRPSPSSPSWPGRSHAARTMIRRRSWSGLFIILIALVLARFTGSRNDPGSGVAKLLVTHTPDERPPFIDATGAHAGALLGDVKHDPFQSGGLETPPHERVEVGAIHKANGGVLFVDEINLLKIESQHSLLTALQERKFPIVGQSERSAGAMVKTEPVPADFVLVAAGNIDSVQSMHPALRSRIRGYGYELYVKTTMPDTPENRMKIVRFVAQEVVKGQEDRPLRDGPRSSRWFGRPSAASGRSGQLTLRLRELGGLVRVAGDIANAEGARFVTRRARGPGEASEPLARAADRRPVHRAPQGVPDVLDGGRRRRHRQRPRGHQRPDGHDASSPASSSRSSPR